MQDRGRRGHALFDLQLPVQSVPITTEVGSSNSAHGEVYSIRHCGRSVSSTNKIDRHDIAEILLKVALSIITLAHTTYLLRYKHHL